jgi:crotonobetainyl-CoA:carnitine CoA-transferase CaiB-like acyl-CoA transferase
LPLVGPPIRLEETPGGVGAPPPLLGEHTREILAEVLDYSEGEIMALGRRGVI